MLSKDKMIPGSKIRVRPVIKDGAGGTTPALALFDIDWGPMLGSSNFTVGPGTVLTVVNKPKKRFGSINLARVEMPDGTQADAYWIVLRASCDHI